MRRMFIYDTLSLVRAGILRGRCVVCGDKLTKGNRSKVRNICKSCGLPKLVALV